MSILDVDIKILRDVSHLKKGFLMRFKCCLIFTMLAFVSIGSNDYRMWTDHKGRTMSAKFLGFSEDMHYIICEIQTTGKVMALVPRLLSSKDRSFIEKLREGSNKQFYTKDNGEWITVGEKKKKDEQGRKRQAKVKAEKIEKNYIKEAERIIEQRSPKMLGKRFEVKVFQTLEAGHALCRLGVFKHTRGSIDSKAGHYEFGDAEIFLCIGVPRKVYHEDAIFNPKNLYWCGEFTYKNNYDSYRKVDILTPNKEKAILLVRYREELFDKGDPRFNVDDKDNVITPERDKEDSKPRIDDNAPSLAAFGSGVIVTSDGYLVTNHHVIKGARKIVVIHGDYTHQAVLIKSDEATDLAVLKIEGKFVPIKMAARSIERLGKDVFTMGFPKPQLQGFAPKVTKGVISSLEGFRGDIREYQFDAAIQGGNSGGPLADNKGNLVGIVSASLKGGENVNYAVKKSYLLAFIDSIPECSKGIVKEDDSIGNMPFEDAVSVVLKSCVQILVYE